MIHNVIIVFLYFSNKHLDIEVGKNFQYNCGKRYVVPAVNLAQKSQSLFTGNSEILFKDISSSEITI